MDNISKLFQVLQNDNIAFPYGKNLREGVKTKISEDDSEMIY